MEKDDNEMNVEPLEAVSDLAMEKWFSFIQSVTFETAFLPITRSEGAALQIKIQSMYKGNTNTLDDEQTRILGQLEEKLDKEIKGFKCAFVKLNTRSPKDAVYDLQNDRTRAILNEELNKIKAQLKEGKIKGEFIAFFTAANRAMNCKSGKEALELLCKSHRVMEDISFALQRPDPFEMKFIIRKFYDISLEDEFRGFVHHGKLVALSQYYHFCYFPSLVQQKTEIETRILQFFDEIKSKIAIDSYVIDFCLQKNGQVMIIELNPYHYGTGACNFSWKKNSPDRKILAEGPFEFRITQTVWKDAKARYLVASWEKYIDSFFQELQVEDRSCTIS